MDEMTPELTHARLVELDKPTLVMVGKDESRRFLANNCLPEPAWVIHGRHRFPERGWYRNGQVHINLARNRPPTKTPGFAWSFPGYKADMTPVGVIAHETGHHIDRLRCHRSLPSRWLEEAPVSGYEPNRNESVAEAIRLMITNPDLLRAGRPARFTTLHEAWDIEPVALDDWEQVLIDRGAHEKFLAAAKNWIKRGNFG